MKNLKVGIVGGGVVGRATAHCYLGHVAEVRVYDVRPERRTHPLDETLGCDLVFVCLPTPQARESLACDTTAVEHFFASLPDSCCSRNYVLRSTVPVGTTRRLARKYRLPNLVHSPEFLTARWATLDAQLPARNLIGHPDFAPLEEDSDQYLLYELFLWRFPGVSVHRLKSDETEAVKLLTNGFYAVKVAYWNEVRWLIDSLGLDWGAVREAVLAGGTVHPLHTQVPGPDGKRGFGGSCLPKDLAALIDALDRADLPAEVTAAALRRNRFDRGKAESRQGLPAATSFPKGNGEFTYECLPNGKIRLEPGQPSD